ncbi:unnamed protein product [Caenorhabditis sp. 36 PRJEB53466]|nr:unnamed protein product [Caenorhabditis sp. 36 PRJEB53466]
MPRIQFRSDVITGADSLWTRLTGQKWSRHHVFVFIHTFMSYAMLHATRKTLSTVKPSLINTWMSNTSTPEGALFPTKQAAAEFLGGLDTGFMIAYAIGLYICGILGDNYNPRRLLAAGMMTSSIVVLSFGYLTETFHFYSPTLYAFLWISNGFIQSVGWPVEVSIMGNWFGHNARGAVMGAWSSCASVGNIIGTLITSHTLFLGYQYSFLIVCTLLFVYSFLVFFQLPSAPWEVNNEVPPEQMNEELENDETTERPPPIGFFRAWLLPGVIAYSLAYACLKLVNYGFFFWLPFYLHSGLHWPESYADALSTWYDVGGIVAAVIAGACSDHMRSRTPVVFTMLIISTFSLYIYAHSPESYNWNAFLLMIAGFFIGGPANMISSSITADLGKCDQLRGNAEALSTVTGIIDGTGSIGAAIGQWFIPSIQLWFGWDAVFYGFIVMIICTAVCLVPVLWKEQKARRTAHRSDEKWTRYHVRVFLHTFIGYVLLHANRKTLSTVKPSLITIWTDNSSTPNGPLFASKQTATEFLGALDTGFMITYATGLYICGALASLIASQTVSFGYQYPFFIICIAQFGYSILTYFHLPSAPWEVEELNVGRITKEAPSEERERPPPLGFFRAWLLPGVIAFSISYSCLKLVNDGFFFWLPFYLHNGLHWPEAFADALAIWYDVGGIIASIAAGALSDRMKSRTTLVFIMLLFSTVTLLAYCHSPESYSWNATILLIVGIFIGGPLNMIAGCITSDLGKSEALQGNAEALSTVSGIIDGTGSIGSAIGQWLIPLVHVWLGWNAIFYGFMILVVCSALCISPVLWRERKEHKLQKVAQRR